MLLQLKSDGDLSATSIQSDTPVAVYSGNIRVGIEGKSRDHLTEQLAPWDKACE